MNQRQMNEGSRGTLGGRGVSVTGRIALSAGVSASAVPPSGCASGIAISGDTDMAIAGACSGLSAAANRGSGGA
jgi:hypothetical protein